jgi:hypothetical protein
MNGLAFWMQDNFLKKKDTNLPTQFKQISSDSYKVKGESTAA